MSTEQQSNFVIEKVMDSRNGEIITVRRDLCGRCHNPLPLSGEGHAICRRMAMEEEATEKERIRRHECMIQFGEILDPLTHQRRLYPDSAIGNHEPWSAMKKREAEAERQAYFKMLQDRDLRKQRLPRLEREIIGLKAQIARDEKEAAEEAKGNVDTPKPDQSLQRHMQYEDDIETGLQQYTRAREQK